MTKVNVPTVAELTKMVGTAKNDDFGKIQRILFEKRKVIADYEDLREKQTEILKSLIKEIATLEPLLINMKAMKNQLSKELE